MGQTDNLNKGLQNRGSGPNSNDIIEIDLLELIKVLWKNLWKIIIAGLVCAIIALAVTIFVIRPTYRAEFTAFVNNNTGQEEVLSVQSGDVTAAQNLTRTYAAIITSRSVLVESLEQAGLYSENEGGYNYDNIGDHISTEVESNTQLLKVYVTMNSPEEAYALADAITQVAPEHLADIVEGSSMKIVSAPVLPYTQHSPSAVRNTEIGFLLGVLLMCAWVIVRMLLDKRVKSAAELEERFGIPVVGAIPDYDTAARGKSGYGYYKKSETPVRRERSTGTSTAKKTVKKEGGEQ